MNLSVTIKDSASPVLRSAIEQLRGPGLIRAAATGVRVELREHFANLEATRGNKNNFPRTHFWIQVRNSVNVPVVQNPTLASVSISDHRIRQRLEGGYIRPGPGKQFLTLPENEQAYGHRAREFHNLHFGFAENRYGSLAPALIEDNAQRVKFGRTRKDGSRKVTPGAEVGGAVYFWLVRQVFQRADPSVLPNAERLENAATVGAEKYAQGVLNAGDTKGGSK